MRGAVLEAGAPAPEKFTPSAPARPGRAPVGPVLARWLAGLVLVALLTVVPYLYYRSSYTHSRRLREVTPGKLYRSGLMTAAGFKAAIEGLGIRTIINLMEEAPDPNLPLDYFGCGRQRESALCQEHGVRYVHLLVDLVQRSRVPGERPAAIDAFLAIMDDPANYPVLIHCKAGLHRTGSLAALYRMEYDGWTAAEALRELKHLGFGEFACSSANDYITQYILTYQPRVANRGKKSETISKSE